MDTTPTYCEPTPEAVNNLKDHAETVLHLPEDSHGPRWVAACAAAANRARQLGQSWWIGDPQGPVLEKFADQHPSLQHRQLRLESVRTAGKYMLDVSFDIQDKKLYAAAAASLARGGVDPDSIVSVEKKITRKGEKIRLRWTPPKQGRYIALLAWEETPDGRRVLSPLDTRSATTLSDELWLSPITTALECRPRPAGIATQLPPLITHDSNRPGICIPWLNESAGIILPQKTDIHHTLMMLAHDDGLSGKTLRRELIETVVERVRKNYLAKLADWCHDRQLKLVVYAETAALRAITIEERLAILERELSLSLRA